MKKDQHKSRRGFIKKIGAGTLAAGTISLLGNKSYGQKIQLDDSRPEIESQKIAPNDKLRLGAIGTGIIGFYNINTALKVPGMELVAACDLYDERLQKIKNDYGSSVSTTKNYQEILDRDDIDVVLIATPDHWHDHIAIEAMKKGKPVYLEKPMVHHIEEGYEVIKAQEKNKALLQVGSQGVSSIVQKKAKDLYDSGAIGDLVLVDAAYDRHSSLGAWQYSIPPSASSQNIDWSQFLGDAPKVDFDPVRFFRWRNYQDYGTGISGDLYVHLISWLNFIITSNGPNKIYSSGGLRYWKDGRNVPDIMVSIMDYPKTNQHAAFNLTIRVNFVAGGDTGGRLKLVGTEGAMTLRGNRLELSKTPFPNRPGYGGYDSLFTFPESVQNEYEQSYKQKYYAVSPQIQEPSNTEYNAPEGYDDRFDHWVNLVSAIKNGKKIVEDASYGLRAAAPSLAANISYFEDKIVKWDPDQMKLV